MLIAITLIVIYLVSVGVLWYQTRQFHLKCGTTPDGSELLFTVFPGVNTAMLFAFLIFNVMSGIADFAGKINTKNFRRKFFNLK